MDARTMQGRQPSHGDRSIPRRAHEYAASPLTRRPALFEPMGTFEAPEPWVLVREADGPAYFASEAFLARCAAHPLPRATADAAIERAERHNGEDSIPAFVTEVEAMFPLRRAEGWAAEGQVFVAVCDPKGQ